VGWAVRCASSADERVRVVGLPKRRDPMGRQQARGENWAEREMPFYYYWSCCEYT
jgi:hypothetical protein